jgi:plasmid stabilization system protein ParE
MRLRWTTPAADDLYHIVRHIQRDNPDAATKVATTITTAATA